MFLDLKYKNETDIVILMNEIALRKKFRYNQSLDLINGYECNNFGKSNNISNKTCVFLIKSIFSSWSTILNFLQIYFATLLKKIFLF